MHSDGQTSVLSDPQPANTDPHFEAHEPVKGTVITRHVFLAQEHRDLDDMIALLANDNSADEALLTRLKKRKLHLKDEMARLEADTPA